MIGNLEFGINVRLKMTKTEDNRVKQIAIGVGFLMLLMLVICGALLGWGYLPGLLGEWVGLMVGVVTTPFLMEASFVIMGLMVVVLINHWRRKRDGDELVFLEQLEGDEGSGALPEHASWAIYREKPLDGETPSLLEQAEGALAIGDVDSAAEFIGEMSESELKQHEVLLFRLELAKASGKWRLADQLSAELKQATQGEN